MSTMNLARIYGIAIGPIGAIQSANWVKVQLIEYSH